jgi:hypothetical protein
MLWRSLTVSRVTGELARPMAGLDDVQKRAWNRRRGLRKRRTRCSLEDITSHNAAFAFAV